MFDESTGISYNSVKNCIEGMVDCCQGYRRPVFADHALVFMLKGVHKGWKQSISFYFCEHTTATADLVRLIKEVVRHVRNTGLEIVATVCAQGATNNSGIKHLINDTAAYCIKNNIENRYQEYLVDGQEAIHLFDYFHMLQGMLTKNLHLENGCNKVASWSHIF